MVRGRRHTERTGLCGSTHDRRESAVRATAVLTLGFCAPCAFGQAPASVGQISQRNWGYVTAPTYGTTETTPGYTPADDPFYAGTELFTGPDKFGSYFTAVLPNGKFAKPAGTTIHIGANPLGSSLTPDGKYLIISQDDERNYGPSLQNPAIPGGYALLVVATKSPMAVANTYAASGDLFFIGLQTRFTNGVDAAHGYTVYASGGPDNTVHVLSLAPDASTFSQTARIVIPPTLPANAGYVSHYAVSADFKRNQDRTGAGGANDDVPTPGGAGSNAGMLAGAAITCPAGMASSADGRYLYVACNGDNSLAVIDTRTNIIASQVKSVEFFPYTATISPDGQKLVVSDWGLEEYKFSAPTYVQPDDPVNARLDRLARTGTDPQAFVVNTSTAGAQPKSSSVAVLDLANPASPTLLGADYEGQPGGLDALKNIGGTHPSAMAVVHSGAGDYLYVTKSNVDSLGVISLSNNRRLADVDLRPVPLAVSDGAGGTIEVHGAYPNAIVVSADGRRAFVAEAGTNTVAVLDTTNPKLPKVVGRIPTDWYPTALSLSADGNTLYILNAKGVGEDINPAAPSAGKSTGSIATGVESFNDGNFIFGTLQQVNVGTGSDAIEPTAAALRNVFSLQSATDPAYRDTSVVPTGTGHGSARIMTVIFILHENKTFDSMLGNRSDHYKNFASTVFADSLGRPITGLSNNARSGAYSGGQNTQGGMALGGQQYTGVSLNTQLLGTIFATAVNYYSDSEESDAGHQFAASGTASDYTEKTLLLKTGRGLLVNKNFEPEDYPATGYIFNNLARHGVTFKDYGAFVRIDGTDTGQTGDTLLNDPISGHPGTPQVNSRDHDVQRESGDGPAGTGAAKNIGDTADQVVTGSALNPFAPNAEPGTPRLQGGGQSYFLRLPLLAVLGERNAGGEPHLDTNYPGYNFNISDQRRAKEFIADFDRMAARGTLPHYIYLYEPNDHTGQATAALPDGTYPTGLQLVADGDVGLGMVVSHIMQTPTYYDRSTNTGAAIIVTYDDAQSTLDHIHEHRTPLIVVSPFAKPGYIGKKHYSTASVVKTEELLLNLPPNNYGDLFATDLRDLFQPTYNGITYASLRNRFTRVAPYTSSQEGRRIWGLVAHLDTAGPDRDSRRLGMLNRMSEVADDLHRDAVRNHTLATPHYRKAQADLYAEALQVVNGPEPKDGDD